MLVLDVVVVMVTIGYDVRTEPVTEIMGGPDLFLNRGSTINLTCIVRFAPEPSPTLSWSHNRTVSVKFL